ncbi:MAG: sulfite exporter TauE/SafE family protein [Candidatus Gracilibacteria bacterium]|nr:sulfite exporter TauE/SafE family protein [bacterium]MDZ4217250.1 sulfite exporter TauE/SafE family protein [Candidatus Gracilibacteria bacterium]
MSEFFLLPVSGFIAIASSLLSAFTGGGMSLVMFPLFLMTLPVGYVVGLAITKVAVTMMTMTSAWVHFKKGNVKWNLFFVMTIFGILGTAVGTYLIQYQLNEVLYERILAMALFTTATYLLLTKDLGIVSRGHVHIGWKLQIQTGFYALLVNILNGLFGGTGIFLTVYLIFMLRLSFLEATAYTMSSYMVINIVQTSYLLATTPVDFGIALVVTIGALIGGWLGTHLQYLKGNVWVKRASIIMMVVVGIIILL